MNFKQIQLLKKASTIVPRRYRADLSLFVFYLTSRRYTGDAVTCPICNDHFSQFVGNAHNTSPIQCPRCISLPRHRLLWLYLTDRTNLFTDKLRMLHFAPEISLYARFKKQPNLDYVTADLDSPLADFRIDITHIPYPDSSFDVILCNHVLEHIDDDHRAMAELYRVLRPGGWAILQSPLDIHHATTFEDPAIITPEERAAHYGHFDHRRIYGLDYKDRLEAAGFAVTVDGYVRTLPAEKVRATVIDPAEDIYLCRKPASTAGQ